MQLTALPLPSANYGCNGIGQIKRKEYLIVGADVGSHGESGRKGVTLKNLYKKSWEGNGRQQHSDDPIMAENTAQADGPLPQN